jgi:heme O synthase-like polyprenyltransferase
MKKDNATAKKVFFFSLFYLFILFAVMGGEAMIGRMI